MKAVDLTILLMVILFFAIPISCQRGNVGEMVISGMVIDQDSKEGIPNIRIKVDGVTQFGLGRRTVSGNTRTDADGAFNVTIKNIENVAFYEFFANWGSLGLYTEGTDYHGESYLDSITNNEIPMIFELSKVEPLKINLKNADPFNDDDYVCLHFYSDSMGFVRVKTVENLGIGNLKHDLPASNEGIRTEWIGANVSAVIYGNILVNEELAIIVTIRKNGQRTEVIKLIKGKRNRLNEIDIDY